MTRWELAECHWSTTGPRLQAYMLKIHRCMSWMRSGYAHTSHSVHNNHNNHNNHDNHNNHNNQARTARVTVFLRVAAMDVPSGQPPVERGAAWRRRQRRLRSMLRHEQQTVRMVLATYQHHSAPRGQRMARTGEGSEKNYTAKLWLNPPKAARAVYFEMDTGRTMVPHLPPGGQHRCCRRRGRGGTRGVASRDVTDWPPTMELYWWEQVRALRGPQ